MVKLSKVLFIAVLGLVLSLQVGIAREFGDIYTECGLGSIIAPRNSAVAAVTNVTWDLGTTAISSNITCPDSCKGGQEKTAAFIYEAYDALEKDLAKGHGEYLDHLMELIESDPKVKDKIVIILRNDFKDLVAKPDYTNKTRFQKAEGLYNIVSKHFV